jgi:hypothetical protein
MKMNVSAEDRNRLSKAGVMVFYGELDKPEYTLRELARICDYAEAWVRTKVKKGDIPATKNKRGHWRVSKAEVHKARVEQVEKLLNRLDSSGKPKKYEYRRPTEWAYHLTVKAIKNDTGLQPAQKKLFIGAMNRYKDQWEQAYKERVAKREANKTDNDK